MEKDYCINLVYPQKIMKLEDYLLHKLMNEEMDEKVYISFLELVKELKRNKLSYDSSSDEISEKESDNYKGNDFINYTFKQNAYTTTEKKRKPRKKKKAGAETLNIFELPESNDIQKKNYTYPEEESEIVDFEGSDLTESNQ